MLDLVQTYRCICFFDLMVDLDFQGLAQLTPNPSKSHTTIAAPDNYIISRVMGVVHVTLLSNQRELQTTNVFI